MNVLITGATGRLGRALSTLLDDGGSKLGPVPPPFKGARVLKAGSEDLDVSDRASVEALFARRKPDLVVHCAALTDVDACEKRPGDAWAVNALGSYLVADAARRAGARMVCLSTDFVFAGTGARPLVERDPSFPRSVYGASKLAGERLSLLAAPGSLVARTAWLHGPSGGDFVDAILCAARVRDRLDVVDDQVGNPTHVLDAADALLRLAAAKAHGVVHCANRGFCSRFEFARAIVERAGLPVEVRPVPTAAMPRPAERPAFAPLDVRRCEGIVGRRMRPWREALESSERFDARASQSPDAARLARRGRRGR